MQARFLKPAEAEVDEAIAYFDSQREDLGARFEKDLLHTITLIAERPLIGRPITKRARKFMLRKFRYNVIYVVDDHEVIIVAVAHHRRRPRYWRSRLVSV
ncbi:MAG: type II toxin-antitoxin system RelE/ParE family toxin [Acidobacteriota bacterium]|nr:type II toxin-antitoxin system RelE/ParE family toxin [Acidobacteriota bacterium]